jgi:hypothetical protein
MYFRPICSTYTTRDALMVAYGERVLNGLALRPRSGQVVELYFPDELHAVRPAGAGLFDLVAEDGIPEVPHTKTRRHEDENNLENSSSETLRGFVPSCETSFLKTLRAKIEELYDAAHPLCQALEKLATLETVRIIEGKA